MDQLNLVLQNCSIFDRIPEDKYRNVLHCLDGVRKTFRKNDAIVNIGDFTQLSGIVLTGTVEAAFFDENGNQISVNFISEGDVFGAERACCDWHQSSTRLRAVSDAEILFLKFDNLLADTENLCPYRARVTANLLRDFARQTQFLNLRIRIIGQKYLRDKLKVYLQTLHMEEDGTIHLPYNRRELAEFLYADRSALSRELARMKEENILDFEGNVIYMIDRNFLKD